MCRCPTVTCVQVHATNAAGSTTSFFSAPITLDETPPTCTPPPLLPASSSVADTILLACGAGGACDRGIFSTVVWIGPEATGLRLRIDESTCEDDERRFHTS